MKLNNVSDIRVAEDPEQLAQQVLKFVLQQAELAIETNGRFVLCLAGGSTPQRLYQLLAETKADYSQWFLLYGDERCLPLGHADRNSTMVLESWLKLAGFQSSQHFVMPAELGAEVGAASYQKVIQPFLPIDLCLLGVGEDGHTASLFPGHAEQSGQVIAVKNSPKPPAERISLNYSLINQSITVCILMAGSNKKEALQSWQNGVDLPITKIKASRSTVLWLDSTLAENKS